MSVREYASTSGPSVTRIADSLERLADTFCPPREAPKECCRSWIVFFETEEREGNLSYTYKVTAPDAETGEEAIRQATENLPRFINTDTMRIHRASAARYDDVTVIEGFQFRQTPQFQVR